MKRIALLIIALSGWFPGFAQDDGVQYPEFPSAREIQPGISAAVQEIGAGFQYTYTVANGIAARQQICQFIVTVRSPEAYGLPKDRWDVIRKERKGMLQVDWGSLDSLADIVPGGPATAFMLQSLSPPGIVQAYVAGLIPPIAGVEKMEFAPGTGHILYNSVKVPTISPVAPAEPFQRLAFVDSLSALVVQSRALGWIADDLIAGKYTSRLDTLRSQLQRGEVRAARALLGSIMQEVSADSASLSGEANALIRCNAAYLLARLAPSREVKAGLFIASAGESSTLMVKGKPSVTLPSTDTLIASTVTLRWPAQFRITLGAVSSSYGYAKVDTPMTLGDYRYQRFAASARTPLGWMAQEEYELFSVPVSGMCGAEWFELTNALADGEWYVIVSYVDKTDSVFYSPSARGYAFDNRTNDGLSTYASGQRHLVRARDSLHEAYASAGEIIYRRSGDDGVSWDITSRISSGEGNNGSSSIAAGADGMLYAVWEQTSESGALGLWFSRSSDNGEHWSVPAALPGCVGLLAGTYQANHLSPVLAELSSSNPRELIIAFADRDGLKYQRSLNRGLTWMSAPLLVQPSVKDATDGGYIWSLSMAPGSNFLVLTYDYRMLNSELVSRTYTAGAGWSPEAIICTATGTTYDRHSSVAVDDDDNPVVAWCAQKTMDGVFDGDYRVMLRKGTPGNNWSTFFTEFPSVQGVGDMYPSVGAVSGSQSSMRGQQVIFQRSNGEVRVASKSNSMPRWTTSLISSSGQWVNASLERRTNKAPKLMFTDLNSMSGLFPVVVTGVPLGVPLLAGPGTSAAGASGTEEPLVTRLRTVVLEDPPIDARLIYGLAQVRCITAQGDTVVLPFRTATNAVGLSVEACWNYLGTEAVAFPSDAQALLVEVELHTEFATPDTVLPGRVSRPISVQRGEHLFSKNRGYTLELVDAAGNVTVLYQDTLGNPVKTALALPAWVRGRTLSFRMQGTVTRSLSNKAVVGVGDLLE